MTELGFLIPPQATVGMHGTVVNITASVSSVGDLTLTMRRTEKPYEILGEAAQVFASESAVDGALAELASVVGGRMDREVLRREKLFKV